MSKWTSEAEARNQIKDLVKDYYEAFKKPEQEKEFKPGDRLSYASRVYDEKEMCRVYGNRMMWMALPFVAGATIDFLYSGVGCLAAWVIWTVQFVLLMKERMKREKIEKNI